MLVHVSVYWRLLEHLRLRLCIQLYQNACSSWGQWFLLWCCMSQRIMYSESSYYQDCCRRCCGPQVLLPCRFGTSDFGASGLRRGHQQHWGRSNMDLHGRESMPKGYFCTLRSKRRAKPELILETYGPKAASSGAREVLRGTPRGTQR